MKFYIAVYDIPSTKAGNKRRRRSVKVLESYMIRVQKSVFEAYLSKPDFEKMMRKLKYELDEDEDSLRIYTMRKDTLKNISIIGFPPLLRNDNYIHVSDVHEEPFD
jgi:CRISPR-associated protein Cas2